MTYTALDSESRTLSEKVGQRCLIFSLCRNEIGSILGYVTFVNNGIVPLLLSSHLEAELLDNLLETYKPAYLWVPEDQIGSFSRMNVVHIAFSYALLVTGFN